ncbi:MAG: hypothetical protein MSR29_05285 [Lachnospiraceae bacterium]|nr:hypothetical protein [Lachnospiraceae bacterium]
MMRLEDIKKDMPKTPEFIHQMICEEVNKQLQNDSGTAILQRKRKKYKWSSMRVAAAVVAALLGVSTIAYAGSGLYRMYLEKQGRYRVDTGISVDSDYALPEKIHDIKIETAYIPEGMEWVDEHRLAYPETPNLGGFSFSSVLLDSDDFGKILTDTGVVESEERTFGSRTGVYLQYQDLEQDGSFNQRIYLLCPEEYRIVILYIGDDVQKEDAMKVAENLSISETDAVMETKDLYTWSNFIEPETEWSESVTEIPQKDLQIFEVGDTLKITGTGENEAGEYLSFDDISVTVDFVQVADDLSLLDENLIPEEWKEVIGEDGKLVQNTLSYIRSGDGVETLDEVVKTESVQQKLVYVTVTYQNNTDTAINHMLYIGSLMRLKQENGQYQIYSHSGEGYDYIRGNSVASAMGMTYFSQKEAYGNGGNYISSLKPGERVQVAMAWIVNENDLGNIYLNLCGSGGSLEFSEDVLRTGLVDIRQLN